MSRTTTYAKRKDGLGWYDEVTMSETIVGRGDNPASALQSVLDQMEHKMELIRLELMEMRGERL